MLWDMQKRLRKIDEGATLVAAPTGPTSEDDRHTLDL
jgi:hypothetical protein